MLGGILRKMTREEINMLASEWNMETIAELQAGA